MSKGKNRELKPSPNTGKVSTARLTKGASVSRYERIEITVSRNEKSGFYRTVLNTCLSFLNEVMASEPFFEERSDAVKMSETPYPTNGSGKNLAQDTGVKYAFCDYPLPDSSLSLIMLWFRSTHLHISIAQE